MNRESTYISQICEAIKYYDENIYEYRRISLILLDNVIEVILKDRLQIKLFNHYKKTATFEEIENIFKGLRYHENVTKEALNLNLINDDEKRLIDYCHEIRNIQYHEPNEYSYLLIKDNKVLIDCGIACFIEFLVKRYQFLTTSEFIHDSFQRSQSEQKILNKNSISSSKQFIEIIIKFNGRLKKRPAQLVSEIISQDIFQIEDFFENYANEDWSIFNKIINQNYLEYIQSVNFKSNSHIVNLYLSDKKITKLKENCIKLRNVSASKAIEKLITFNNEYDKVLIGMKMYGLNQEYIADRNDI